MKSRTLKQLRPKRQPEQHHNVYVVLLDPAVGKLRKVRAENPKRNPKKQCVYVGMTGLTPEERFANHKAGIKAASVVKRYGIRLLPELYAHLEPDALRCGGGDGKRFGGRFTPGWLHGVGRALSRCFTAEIATVQVPAHMQNHSSPQVTQPPVLPVRHSAAISDGMTPLPSTIRFDGFTFRQIERNGDVALFEKGKPTHTRSSFEVVIVQKHPAKTFPSGKYYEARESMPRSEDWGVRGWDYTNLENAQTKFNQLAEAAVEPVSDPTPFPGGAFSGRRGYKVPDRMATCLNPKRGRERIKWRDMRGLAWLPRQIQMQQKAAPF